MAILSIELFERNKCRLSQGGKTSHDDNHTFLNKFFFIIFFICIINTNRIDMT